MSRVGIIGGGPAGLSIARLLNDTQKLKPVVFEAAISPGGKSQTLRQGNSLVELGTCYTTTAYKQVHSWMAEEDIHLRRMTKQLFDDTTFEAFVRQGGGAPTAVQGVRYLRLRAGLLKRLSSASPSATTLAEAAMPAEAWLEQHNLPKIFRLFLRTYTNLGYGFLDTVPILHVMRWTDFDLIWSGLRKKLKMPIEGWSEFWERFASHLDVRTNARVTHVERHKHGVTLTTIDGHKHEFDQIVCAIPVDDFAKLTAATPNEEYVNESVFWNGYTTTLFAAENWFTNVDVHSYSETLLPGADKGRVMSARRDGYEPDLGGHLYLSGQISGTYTSDELKELLHKDLKDRGVTIKNIIQQRMWKYHAEYKPDAIKDGLLQRLKAMQGDNNTWYTGATFSHESVTHIVRHNTQLAQDMQRRLLA